MSTPRQRIKGLSYEIAKQRVQLDGNGPVAGIGDIIVYLGEWKGIIGKESAGTFIKLFNLLKEREDALEKQEAESLHAQESSGTGKGMGQKVRRKGWWGKDGSAKEEGANEK